jgi:GNAT superfamily N-acetyltransferase
MQPAPDASALVTRVVRLWEHLAGAPGAFGGPEPITVVISPDSKMSPPSWVGIVVVGDRALVAVPTERQADRLRAVLIGLPVSAVTDPAVLTPVLPVVGTRGPATLAYLAPEEFRPHGDGGADQLPNGHAGVARLVAGVPAEDASESGMGAVTSPVFAVRQRGRIVSVAGYRSWPCSVAHLSVLTHPRLRGRGLARIAASAAARHALEHGLLPQWRARPFASRRVAQALGFREMGQQLSLLLCDADPV